MFIILVGGWLAIFWLLVSIGVFSKWHRWMKLSPIIIWVVAGVLVFLPMGWVSPTGPAIVLARSIQIAPSISGIVTEVTSLTGAPLKKGDVLFKLDRTTFQAVVDQNTALLELANDRLEQKTQLLKKGAGRRVDVEDAETEVKNLNAKIQVANWNLEQTVVKAPADGFVSSIVLPVGARVSAGVPVMPFFDGTKRFLVVQIQQNHLRYIKPGQQAEVIFNVLPGHTFPATVVLISRANPAGQVAPSDLALATETPKSDPFWVVVKLDDESIDPRPGITGTAAIYTKPSGARYFFRRLLIRMQSFLTYIFVF
jgi:multidrug resistance efflux pump